MSFCKKCGTEVTPEAEFYGNCGVILKPQPAQPSVTQIPPSQVPSKTPGMAICSNCGAALPVNVKFCQRCGVDRVSTSSTIQPKVEHSAAWYIAPIILTIIGGIIGYLVIKDDDPKMARNLFIIGLIMLVVSVIIFGYVLPSLYEGGLI